MASSPPPRALLIASLAILALLLATASLLTGPTRYGLHELLGIVSGTGDPLLRDVLIDLRLPRAVLGLLVGAMLGLAGAVLQGYLRNPLAEPSILGTSNAAALGAVIALYFGLSQMQPATLPLLAIAGAFIGLAPLLLLARKAESPLSLILAGIAVGTAAGAGISLALNLAPNPFAGMEIMSWLMGSLEDRSFTHVWIALPCILPAMALLFRDGHALDALTLGEDAARTLGIDLSAVRIRLMLGIAIGVGAAVAVSGAIGFVGLIVPHLLRPFTDRAPSSLLLPSALGGGALLCAADIVVRLIPTSDVELRLGVLTALLGVPIFVYHLARERRLW
ncbi:FecCD family ABC transporter permease [Rhizorhabdus phycosphaerae]|uniref:FecCD family ABC transporter permease n=1 Tax=Rhizorhabdus phycosphaerae TaxID=2711156 RepID=UPI0013EDDB0F|nr:iron ABC transporter permease [Rhizorhabdus phycosphaerae]